ncbi:hypothetical protein [Microbacterium sp. SS28]|uniref:hypothetical protein n=1 Tax=Microbacterium sp. SS28 TaxID=2919948 RepID=UPI001FA9CD0B|nr:hypothetical protein [Microbacterium sp. SS28]
MDPLWATVAEFWWIAPAVVGAGVFAMLGLLHQRSVDSRRLEYDAARLELADARTRTRAARSALKLARAQVALAQAERAAARATSADVGAARRGLQSAERALRAASADLRVRRARVSTARAGLAATSDPAHRPLAMLVATHDSITARWMEYETDAARLIMFPAMSDGRVPETAAYLTARAEAQRLRPASAQARITPVAYSSYRGAVDRLVQTFEVAEREAWRQARAAGMAPPQPRQDPAAQWSAAAQGFLTRSTEALARSTEAIARASEGAAAVAAFLGTRPAARSEAPEPVPSRAEKAQEPAQPRQVWPVPARGARPPAS